jgi:DNA-binding NarL/FixJ family response regulator
MELPAVPEPDPITAVIVDPHLLFRSGLRQLLEADGVTVLGDAASAADGCELVERLAPDVAIVDPVLPDAQGAEAIRQVAAGDPRTRVLALATRDCDADAVEVVLAGASCYLLKEMPASTIVASVWSAAAGEALIAPRVAEDLLGRLRTGGLREGRSPKAILTERERDVLRLVADGLENDAIARELYISSHTVKNHISSILEKLQVANRLQAAVLAVREALV